MRIIGHRGAAGLALENSVASIKAAINAGVDGIEFDIQTTKDEVVVLSHDDSLSRIFGVNKKISSLTLDEIKQFRDPYGETIATLKQIMSLAGTTRLFIEGKGSNWSEPLAKLLNASSKQVQCAVLSFNHLELARFGKLCSDIPLYGLENHNPFDVINAARIHKFNGIDINYWTLNPLAYFLAKRHKMDVIVYTVNKPWMAQFLKLFYPNIGVTTDVPHKMQALRTSTAKESDQREKVHS